MFELLQLSSPPCEIAASICRKASWTVNICGSGNVRESKDCKPKEVEGDNTATLL